MPVSNPFARTLIHNISHLLLEQAGLEIGPMTSEVMALYIS